MASIPQVVVVGSYVQDLSWRCAEFPKPGQTTVGQFATGPGGKGSNQAIAAGRAGVPTLFVGALGCDALGKEARAFYREEGIDAHFVEKPGHATGTAAILVNSSGQNEIVVALGANGRLAKNDVPLKAIRQAKIVVTQLESNLAATAHALKIARRAHVTTVLNPAPMREDFDPALLACADILIPNETEFLSLLRMLPEDRRVDLSDENLLKLPAGEMHAQCRKLGTPVVIVTLGSRGCFVSQPGNFLFIAAHQGVEAIDTTGAGDAFVGGFAAGWIKFRGDVVAAAHFGNAVAALSVTKVGTAPSMPKRREIASFLKQRNVFPLRS